MHLLNPITAPLNVKKVMDCLQTSLLILLEFFTPCNYQKTVPGFGI